MPKRLRYVIQGGRSPIGLAGDCSRASSALAIAAQTRMERASAPAMVGNVSVTIYPHK